MYTKEDLRWVWVAGLLEGEASFGIRRSGSLIGRCSVQVASNDEDVVRRLKRWTTVGNIGGPYNYGKGKNWQDHWRWSVNSKDQLLYLLPRVQPFMCQRRSSKIKEMLTILEAT